jgi:hypothetical protein
VVPNWVISRAVLKPALKALDRWSTWQALLSKFMTRLGRSRSNATSAAAKNAG